MGPDSLRVYVPTWTAALVTVAAPDVPLIGVGPAADNVQAVGGAVAPVVPLSTTLTRVSFGVTAVFVIVHCTTPPDGMTTRTPVTTPPWQTQVPEAKPAGPVSDRS